MRANARLEAIYRKKLLKLVDDMNDSILYWLSASYKTFDAEIAQDANPIKALQKTVKDLALRWLKNFKIGAEKLADWHTNAVLNMTDAQLKGTLKDAGFTVKMQITPSMQSAYDAVIAEQVGLITNISVQQSAQIETLVMQSVQAGRDLKTLTDELESRFGITRRRAKLIARDVFLVIIGTWLISHAPVSSSSKPTRDAALRIYRDSSQIYASTTAVGSTLNPQSTPINGLLNVELTSNDLTRSFLARIELSLICRNLPSHIHA
jgi:uncharacterized protein with gpF-like domain